MSWPQGKGWLLMYFSNSTICFFRKGEYGKLRHSFSTQLWHLLRFLQIFFVGSSEVFWDFVSVKCLLLSPPFRILGTTTWVSCPGSSLSLLGSRALALSMDLFSLLPGRFLAQSCGFCLQAVPSSCSFGVLLQTVPVGRHKVWRVWRPRGECRKTKSDFKTRLKAAFQWSQSAVPQAESW